MSHTSRPAVPRSHRQSTAVPLLLPVESHQGSLTFFLFFFVFFLFTLWDNIYYCRIVSFVFGVFPCHSFFSAVTRFGLMELETEMQLSGHHECWGCSITMVNGVKDFLYSRFLCTGRYQLSWRWILCFIVILTVYHISDVFSTSGNHRIFWEGLYSIRVHSLGRLE